MDVSTTAVANERIRRLQGEFWRLHTREGDYGNPNNSVLANLHRREHSQDLSAEEKQNIVGYLNLSFAKDVGSAARHAGILPLTRLGQTPAVAVQASQRWISQGYHLPRHNPSFRAFVAQRVAEGSAATASAVVGTPAATPTAATTMPAASSK